MPCQPAAMSFSKRFADLGIETTTNNHAPVFTVEEAQARPRPDIPGGHCKNLFCKDEKGVLWLIVCLEDARVDLKAGPGNNRLKAALFRQTRTADGGSGR